MEQAVLMGLGVLGVLVAGVSKGGFGGAASFVGGPMLALSMPPQMALAVMLPLLMVMDAASLRAFWARWDPAETLRLGAGGLVGIALAAMFLRDAPPDLLRMLIGTVALGFVAWQLAGAPGLAGGPALLSRTGIVFGAAAGATSFVAHAGGPLLLVCLLARGLSKGALQATTVAVFAVFNLLKLVLYTAMGFIDAAASGQAVLLGPVALVGALLGVRAHAWIPERGLLVVTQILLASAGARLVWQAMS